VSISAFPGLNINKGDVTTLTANVTQGGPAPTYQWYVNGILVTGAVTSSLTSGHFANGDVVSCQVLSSGGCSGIPGSGAVTLNVSDVGVANIAHPSADVKIVPNPNKGSFVVKGMVYTEDKFAELTLTNVLGQVVHTQKAAVTNGAINEPIELEQALPNGTYLLNVRTQEGASIYHVVIEQ